MRAYQFITESPAAELAKQLPGLAKHTYKSIDALIQKIARRHAITGKALYDMFVDKYKKTPANWIKSRLNESTLVIVVDGKPMPLTYIDRSEAERDRGILSKRFPQKKVELKQEVCQLQSIDQLDENENDKQELSDQIKKFVKWASTLLKLKTQPEIELSYDTKEAQDQHHTGRHTTGDNKIWVYVKNRNLVDILRTVAHELRHVQQGEQGLIKPGDSYPGSPIEQDADQWAGKWIKVYGEKHHEIFQ